MAQRDIVPGIKVDKGKEPLALSPFDLITYGLDGLADRLIQYKSPVSYTHLTLPTNREV